MTQKQPRTGKDFIELAQKSDKVRQIRPGKRSHFVVVFKDGTSAVVPMHGNKEPGKGLRQKLLKAFKAAGVISLALLVLWIGFFWNTIIAFLTGLG
ncbi:MAG: hypothetical protein AB1791_03540 [Chloroflexota bacterium]